MNSIIKKIESFIEKDLVKLSIVTYIKVFAIFFCINSTLQLIHLILKFIIDNTK